MPTVFGSKAQLMLWRCFLWFPVDCRRDIAFMGVQSVEWALIVGQTGLSSLFRDYDGNGPFVLHDIF